MTDTMTAARRSAHMARIGSGLRKNSIERRVHEVLKGAGVRHKMYPQVRPSADVLVPTRRGPLYVMVDGCFWHACPEHYRAPKDPRPSWGHDLVAEERRRQWHRSRAPWPWLRIWEHHVRDPLNARDMVLGVVLAAVRRVEAGQARGQVRLTWADVRESWEGPPWR